MTIKKIAQKEAAEVFLFLDDFPIISNGALLRV